MRSKTTPTIPPVPPKNSTPEIPFAFKCSPEAYNAIGEPFLYLTKGIFTSKLPDLRPLLVSYGINCRPDSSKEKAQLLIGIRGQLPPASVKLEEKVYLKHDPRPGVHRWGFSENNTPTAIWIEAEVKDNQIVVRLKMKDSQGKIIKEPHELSNFALPEIPLPQNGVYAFNWQVGADKVDATLLTRQKAKWFGQDLFLQNYGGDEFTFARGRERIEFGEGASQHVIFAKEGDIFVYTNDMWQSVEAGPESHGKPLLQVKKVSEQSISFILWDPEGKHKVPLELFRTPEQPLNPNSFAIKLLGARTRQDWIAEIAGKRTLLRTDDWLLWNAGKCERLLSNQQINEYLSGQLRGELIILEGTEKINNELCLIGYRFNEYRTKFTPICIPLYKTLDSMKDSKERKQETLPNQIGLEQNGAAEDDQNSQNTSDDEDEEYEDEDDDDDFI
ncbi:MAG: hypothetical protein JWO53_771 [Chlamydiia bacterium]|nr:hypothetical protein [Chlamydiia bacterium]